MTPRRNTVLPGFRLTLGFTIFYLCVIVLIPLLTLPIKTASLSWQQIWTTISDPRVVASYKLSVGAALAAAAVNGVFGLLVAWVLARYDFPGRRVVDALIDLPFALPTAVAGITLTTLYAPERMARGTPRAVRHQGRVHAPGDCRRSDIHRVAVRRPHTAARHRRSRRRDRRGSHESGRDKDSGVDAASSFRICIRRGSRALRLRSRAPSASTGRWSLSPATCR